MQLDFFTITDFGDALTHGSAAGGGIKSVIIIIIGGGGAGHRVVLASKDPHKSRRDEAIRADEAHRARQTSSSKVRDTEMRQHTARVLKKKLAF